MKTSTYTMTCGLILKPDDRVKKHLAASLSMDDTALDTYLNPTASDYLRLPCRALSACPVQGNRLDFGYNNGQALKDAMQMFGGMTILKDHCMSVDGWLGSTEEPWWDEGNGELPPGVNVMLSVDTKADPKTARGLIAGDLKSTSVTVTFEYDQSHPKMDEYEFACKLGTVVDGKMVQALVTKITRLYELSVVWAGADEFAGILCSGGRRTGRMAEQLSQHHKEDTKVDPKKLAQALSLALENPTEETITAALLAQGSMVTTLQANVEALTAKKAELEASVTSLTTDVTAKATEIGTLQTANEALKAQAKIGETFLEETRQEALRLYNLVEGTKATEALRKLIKDSSLEVAKSFVTSYQDRAEQLSPMKCQKCGSTDINRRASQQSQAPTPGGDGDPNVLKVDTSQLDTDRVKKALVSIHGE